MKIHFIGIDGISMSALAKIMQQQGHQISGSDLKKGFLTQSLIDRGAIFFNTQTAKNIIDINPDIVVYTAAINENNPELIAARNSKAIIYDRAAFLGELTKKYSKSIAISGSHGKTTTTAMLTSALVAAKKDPTSLVGGELADIKGNVIIGKSEIFVTEACEYVESFLKIFPHVGVILNIDKDHLDYFKNIEHIISAFTKFSDNVEDKGYLVINNDDEYSQQIIANYRKNLISFGIDNNSSWMAKNIRTCNKGTISEIYHNNKYISDLHLISPGKHNIYNALAVLACCDAIGVEIEPIIKSLRNFKGIHRRFELRGMVKEATLIDDYAHHPKEIQLTLSAIKESYPNKNITVIFQPHTYSRTKSLLTEFSKAFLLADKVYITPTYPAREPYDHEGDSLTLINGIQKNQDNVQFVDSYLSVAKIIYTKLSKDDIIITMGAGPVDNVIDILLDINQKN